MKRLTLTIHDAAAAAIREAASAPDEMAGVLIAGVSETDSEIRFLAREFMPVPLAAYRDRTPFRLRLGSSAYMGALARAERLGASALFVHSHPVADPVMSELDDVVDASLRSVFQIRTHSPLYGSIVVRMVDDRITFSGRAWRNEAALGPISLLREMGSRFRFTPAFDALESVPEAAVFDRQVRAFGAPMQALLSRLHVGIVGGGGTGSAVGEQLIRLGVGTITAIDFDTVSDTNVTRIYGSHLDDAPVSVPKVEIMRRSAESIGLGTRVHAIRDTVTNRSAAAALRACDFVFACTDDHSGRLVLAKLAYWMLIPVIDLGVRIYGDGSLTDVVCRVNIQVPGAACAQCCGFIDPTRLHAESLTAQERHDLEREGYVPDLDTPDPAVITFTTMAAAHAVSAVIGRLTGLDRDPADMLVITGGGKEVIPSARRPKTGHWCGDPTVWGTGNTHRFLDMVWP